MVAREAWKGDGLTHVLLVRVSLLRLVSSTRRRRGPLVAVQQMSESSSKRIEAESPLED